MSLANELRELASRAQVHKFWVGNAAAKLRHAADVIDAAEFALMEHGYKPRIPTAQQEQP